VNCTVQYMGQSVLKGNWGYTECVRCEYLYGKSRLLKQTANEECLSLLFVGALFVIFVTNNNTGNVGVT